MNSCSPSHTIVDEAAEELDGKSVKHFAALAKDLGIYLTIPFLEVEMPKKKDDGPKYFVAHEDLVTQMTAYLARGRGLSYREADLLAPARLDSGEFIGYLVIGVGLVTEEESKAEGFDLCAVETASLQGKQSEYEQQLTHDPEFAEHIAQVEASGADIGTPAKQLSRLNCTPR